MLLRRWIAGMWSTSASRARSSSCRLTCCGAAVLQRKSRFKLLQHLRALHPRTLQGCDAAKRLTTLISDWLRISRQAISPKVAAALQAFAEHHPQVLPFIDDSLLSRLAALSVPAALAAVAAL